MKRLLTSALLALTLGGCSTDLFDKYARDHPATTPIVKESKRVYTNSAIIDSNGDKIPDTKITTTVDFFSETNHQVTTTYEQYKDGKTNPNPLAIRIERRSEFERNGETWIKSIKNEVHDSGNKEIKYIFDLPDAWADYNPDGKTDYQNSFTLEYKKRTPIQRPRPKPKLNSVA